MRWMRLFILLSVLLPFMLSAQHYSEGACVLLLQQAERFSNQKNHPSYKSARREYDRHCLKAPQRTQQAVKAAATVKPTAPIKDTQVSENSADVAAAAAAESRQNVNAAPVEITVTKPEPAAVPDAQAITPTDQISDIVLQSDVIHSESTTSDVVAAAPAVAASLVQQPVAVAAENSTDVDVLLLTVLSATPLIAANIVAFLLLVFLLTNWFGLNLPGFKGVFAEYKLHRLLRWRLSKDYLHFRKLRLTNDNNETVVIDHLVLSPYGIFVIMVKGYRGRITGSVSQANWTRDYLGRSKQFMNPLHQNFKNMQALKQLLALSDFEQTHSVIAFARVGQFTDEMPANITYIDTTANFIKQHQSRCISDEQLARYAALIKQACE